ncbi:CpsD/CapB family tyrosine-protein kinase [Aliiroseovarius sp. YM-037]|uniref:CpsD/CapB family tyrosine-protein kinase n=1 Tax=Aliiroseovarius sp. YM-037 TaxID=3341728 RepID=UPI003A7FAC3A
MERIQSAIEKARAAREQDAPRRSDERATGSAKSARATDPVNTQAAEAAREELWSAIPEIRINKKRLMDARIVACQAGTAAAPFDVMRTKMLHQMRTNNWRRVAVTSPTIGCGKTTTCLNLAFSLARQRDIKAIVVELDMRRPSIAKVLNLDKQLLFASVIEGLAPPEDHMVRYQNNLLFATNHSPAVNPAEILQGRRAAAIIDEIEDRYKPDIMIFDMPPMLVCDDTIAFLDQIDCALLVGAAEATAIEEMDKCEQDISSRTNTLGFILNKCRYLENTGSYGY